MNLIVNFTGIVLIMMFFISRSKGAVEYPSEEKKITSAETQKPPIKTSTDINQFEFEVESIRGPGTLDVRSVKSYRTIPDWEHNTLLKLDREELTKLCLRVRKHLSLDGKVYPEGESFYPLLDKMVYKGRKERRKYYIGMSCDTIPKSWIRVIDNEKKKIGIMIMDWDKYQNYTFEILQVQPDQVKRERSCRRTPDECPGSKYWDSERLLVCFFAKKRVKKLMLTPKEPVLLTEESRDQAIYDINLKSGRRQEIAFLCPSSPPMYAYYDGLNDKRIEVLLEVSTR